MSVSFSREELRPLFEEYDRDQSGELSMQEVSRILVDLNLQPKSAAEQAEISRMMDDVDADGSGLIDFDEFLWFVQRLHERLHAMKRKDENREAKELRYSQD